MGLAMSASMSAGPNGEQSAHNFKGWALVFTVSVVVFIISLLAIVTRKFVNKSRK